MAVLALQSTLKLGTLKVETHSELSCVILPAQSTKRTISETFSACSWYPDSTG
jgi:hypothetical protein